MGRTDELTAAMLQQAMKVTQIENHKGKVMTAMGTGVGLTLHSHVWEVTNQRLHHVPAHVMSNGVSNTDACTTIANHGSRSAKTDHVNPYKHVCKTSRQAHMGACEYYYKCTQTGVNI